MKKIFTTLSLITISAFGFAQSLHLIEKGVDVTNDTILVSVSATFPFSAAVNDIDIYNSTNASLTYLTQRVILNAPLNSTCMVSFCTGINCYVPSPNMFYTEPGSGNLITAQDTIDQGNGLIAHYDMMDTSICCDAYVLYKVYNVASGTNDTARVTFHYKCTQVGIDKFENAKGSISNAYPNPANEFVSIKYNVSEFSQKGKIVFYDMLGKLVKEVILQDKKGNAKVDVSDFNAGVYFYSFVVDEKAIATKKLVISSK